MDNQIPERKKTERSAVMIAMGHAKQRAYEEAFQGRKVTVLAEEKICFAGEEYWIGHTKEYIKVAVRSAENLENKLVKCVVCGRKIDGIAFAAIV